MINKKGQTTVIVIIAAVLLLSAGLFTLYKYGVFGQSIQFADGYTRIGSDLELTNESSIPQSSNYAYQTSEYYTSTNAIDLAKSTDQDLVLTGTQCTAFNEPIGERKIRIEMAFNFNSATSGSTSSIYASIRDSPQMLFPVNPNWDTAAYLIGNSIIEGGQVIYSQEAKSESDSGLIEFIPNSFNTNVDVYANGQSKATFDSSIKKYLWICSRATGSMTIHLQNLRYQPLLACEKDPSDMFATQTFSAGDTITVDKFRFPVKQFCATATTTIIKDNTAGNSITDSNIIYTTLANGGSMTVPAGEVWRIPFVFDNSKGIVPVRCADDAPLNENNVCEQQSGLVEALSQGTVDQVSNTIIYDYKTACEQLVGIKAIWYPDPSNPQNGTCVAPPPVIEYQTATGSELRVSTKCANDNFIYNTSRNACIANVGIVCDSTSMTATSNGCVANIQKPASKISYIWWIIGALIVIIGLIIWMVMR